jgi:hypothetical protein
VLKVTNAPAFRKRWRAAELLRARLRWGAAGGPVAGCLALGHAGTTGHRRLGACVALRRCDFSYVNSFHNRQAHAGYSPSRSTQPLEPRLLLSEHIVTKPALQCFPDRSSLFFAAVKNRHTPQGLNNHVERYRRGCGAEQRPRCCRRKQVLSRHLRLEEYVEHAAYSCN